MTAQSQILSSTPTKAAPRSDQEQQWSQLMNAIARGEQEAFTTFYDQTHRLVFSLALRILGNRETAEEVTTDIYLQVWRQAAQFEAMRGTVLSWLMTIARTRSIDRLRASSYLRQETETLETVVHYAAPGDNPEKMSIYAERSQMVRSALAQLTPEQRRLIEAAYFEGLSQTELAERFALPLGTVKTRVRAGMMLLKKHFG
jgi:RNA polymerase sigma-70 factor (ECF subfamily)